MTADPQVVARLRAAGCVFAEEEAELLTAATDSPAALVRMVDRRAAGEPLEQILGWAEFCGLRIAVEPGVFVPRRRSELMVREAAALAGPRPVVLDLCCGSGALGVALAAALDAASSVGPDRAVRGRCRLPSGALCPPERGCYRRRGVRG